MKTKGSIKVNPQLGIDRSIPAPPETAQQLQNWKYDPQTKGWTNRFGFEPYFAGDLDNGPFTTGAGLNKRIDSLYVFQRHNSKQQYVLFECNGKLCHLKPYVANQHVVLQTGRTTPSPESMKTTYEPFGRYCIITNGKDAPVKFRGNERVLPLGWNSLPATPIVRSASTVTVSGIKDAFEATLDFVGPGDQIFRGTDSTFEGITADTDAVESVYFYKVSFINEAGSESPLSGISNRFSYTSNEITRVGNTGVPKVCPVIEIPLGPDGTVARRLYRTKTNGDKSLFFQVDTIKNNTSTLFVDTKADISLGPEAPGTSESIIFPAPACRFSASFKSSLFIDGGESDPTRLYYSATLEPDRFKALNYFEVGTREGGDITGLEAYYNSLLVFRENAIDLIRSDRQGGFELVPFVEGIGTFANSCIVAIPKIGVAFLSQDGVYLISGGLDGGADLVINKISPGLDELFERIALDTMSSSVGAYSQREKELLFWMPISGRPNLFQGLCFHVENGQWTERSSIHLNCIAVDRDGNFLFGMDEHTSSLVRDNVIRRGIFAMSGIHADGIKYALVGSTTSKAQPATAKFRSQWLDMGAPEVKKFVKYINIYAITGGDQEIQVKSYIDRDWNNAFSSGTATWQVADAKDQDTYDNLKITWDKAAWQDKRLVVIRYPVATGACSEFAFEIETQDPMTFVGYSIDYQVDGTKNIGGKRGI